MRRLFTLFALLCLAPSVWASAGPMDEKDMQELATLIAHGVITDVACQGEPEFDGTKTYTPYWATLTIDAVEKGEDLASVTLPFSTLVFEPDAALPKCDWAPYYEVGFKGLFYVTSGADSDLYTLVGEGAFVPDEDSVGEALPSCEATEAELDATASEDVSESTVDTSASSGDVEVGPEPDAGSQGEVWDTWTHPEREDETWDPCAPCNSEFNGGDGCPGDPCCDDDDCDAGGVCQDDNQCSYPGPDADAGSQEEVWDACVDDSECGECGYCSEGQCFEPPSCPVCTSDSDCGEGHECVWIDSVTSECEAIGGSGDGTSDDSPSGGGNAGSGDSGGCASGGSHAPLTLALLTLGVAVLVRRLEVAKR